MSSRIVTIDLSTFTFEQIYETQYQLAEISPLPALLNDLNLNLCDELDDRALLRKVEETQ